MKEDPAGDQYATLEAADELADLQQRADEVRADLAKLQRDVVVAGTRLEEKQTAQLVEANARLVVSAMQAQTDTASAVSALNEASQSAGLDALTGLPNRLLLLDRFAQAIASAKRSGTRMAVLFVDLNHFKQINDTLGHAVGDEVLKLAAHCLVSSVRDADTVCRYGGDEFLILLPQVSQASAAILVADKAKAALGAHERVGEHVLSLSASIGISIYPDDAVDADTLIELADAAMYRAKRHGLGSFAFHGQEPVGERGSEPPAPAPSQATVANYEQALAGHQRRYADLREANEQLLLAALAALGALDLQTAAAQAHRNQTEPQDRVSHMPRRAGERNHVSRANADSTQHKLNS